MDSNKQGGIENLLLLGCLAGVVAFFALFMAITATMPDPDSSTKTLDFRNLLEKKEAKEHLLEKLIREYKLLERKVKDLERSVASQREIVKEQREILKKRLATLKEEYARLKNEIRQKRKELSRLKDLPRSKDRDKLKAELEKLKGKLKSLETRINQIMASMASIKKKEEENDLEEVKICQEREYYALKKKREKIKKEVSRLKIRLLTGGSHHYKNPIYIECRKEGIVLYPSAEAVTNNSLNEAKVSAIITGKDVVVLFVRPNGFDTFE